MTAVGMHIFQYPDFPGYLFSVVAEPDETIMYASCGYQIWLLILIWSNTFCIEVIMIMCGASLCHCLESVSFRGAVVMAHNQCDLPHLNEVLIKNWSAFDSKTKDVSNTAPTNPPEDGILSKPSSALSKKKTYEDESYYLAHVVQNVVDIQYALDRYKDIEAATDGMNMAFGPMIFHHQSIYMSLMCTLFYTPIRHLKIIPTNAVFMLGIVAFYYMMRLFMWYPAMGKLNHQATSSWTPGWKACDIYPRGSTPMSSTCTNWNHAES